MGLNGWDFHVGTLWPITLSYCGNVRQYPAYPTIFFFNHIGITVTIPFLMFVYF